MAKQQTISLKSDEIFNTKKQLNIALNILISILGISALFIKFFLVDGVLAFRAFTVDGNIFTTIVSLIVVVVNLKEFEQQSENESKWVFYLQLASAVTESVIFIVVMIGYLPMFPDNPTITPYHMFCLHVAIPVLAVLRFIFFEKPLGVLKPARLLVGAIPIGVYGVGVVTAIKLGILPISLVPYSFLDFDSNFLWYVIFALIVIPSLGFLWSWLFYRLNLRASLIWYTQEELEKLQKERIKSLSGFDVINSSILLIFCMLALVVLMFSLIASSSTTTKVQHELLSDLTFYVIDDYDHMLGDGKWHIDDGVLYKGEVAFGDGTEENSTILRLNSKRRYADQFEMSFFVQSKDLSPEIAQKYDPYDYVCVKHSAGEVAPITACGDVLDRGILATIIESENHTYYEEVKVDGEKYFHYVMTFGKDMVDSGVGIISAYISSDILTAQAKDAEYNLDIMMVAIIVAVFAILYVVAYSWIKSLQKSIYFLKDIASGKIPDEPIKLGKSNRLSGLERELNVLREINQC